MRRLFYTVLSLAVLGLLFIGWMGVLSETHPYAPGNLAYPLQALSEQVRFLVEHTSVDRAYYAMEIFNRQASALAKAQDSRDIERIAGAMNESLAAAQQYVASSPYSEQDVIMTELAKSVQHADVVISALTSSEEMVNLNQLNQTVVSFMGDYQSNLKTMHSNAVTQAIVVPFLSKDIPHMSMDLSGAHTRLDCDSCHDQGMYSQTQYQCYNCHNNPAKTGTQQVALDTKLMPDGIDLSNPYPDHFEGRCVDCHSVTSWSSKEFDHSQAVECDSCHASDVPADELANAAAYAAYLPENDYKRYASDTPADHYAGACLRCHSDTSDWSVVAFTHRTSEACENCHSGDTPAAHYDGTCITCHQNTEDWLETSHHDDYTDCASCHKSELPNNHYTGQCYNCHFPSSWKDVAFDHTGRTNCTSCHVDPDKHYTEQCANCHTTLSWDEVSVVHKKNSKCSTCHRSDVPNEHYSGTCSLCHSFDGWRKASYDHNTVTTSTCSSCHADDAPDAHYDYECDSCHVSYSWYVVEFSHINANDCESCHLDEKPTGHYDGSCASCHSTSSWTGDIHFDHTNYTVCIDCHSAPDGHYDDVCTDCHNTTSWAVNSVDHALFSPDCSRCHTPPEDSHYLKDCTVCHNTINWDEIAFDHTGYDNCTGCHAPPDGHWPGQCSYCHVTETWADINFDHSTYTDCKSCHVRPDGHPRGQCSNCHTTDTWEIPDPTPTPTPQALPGPTATPAPPSLLPTPVPDQNN